MTLITRDLELNRILSGINPEPLRREHLGDIADLHYQQLSWSFNGQFGPKHILDLYEALFHSQHFFGYVYYNSGELLGFTTATRNYIDTRHLITRVFSKKICKTLWVLIRHPRFLLAAFESRFLVPRVFEKFGTKAEWLTLLTNTSKSYLSPFVALKMIDVITDHFRQAGIKMVMAQGFKDNPKAIRFYEKLGWCVVQSLLMHHVYYYPIK